MKVLKSKGFVTHQELTKFVEENNMPLENIYSIIPVNQLSINIVLFFWIQK